MLSCNFFYSVCKVLLLAHISSSQYQFRYVDPSTCQPDQFFNSANQQCESCPSFLNNSVPTSNALECVCLRPNFKQVVSTDNASPFVCEACAAGTIASRDGTECIECLESIVQDQCTCSDTTAYLDERYPNGTIRTSAACISCTGGTGPSSETGRCTYCPTCNPSQCACNLCRDNDVCLNNVQDPAILSAADDSQLESTSFIGRISPAAYAGCLFSESPNITACQTLSNMCVMQLYQVGSTAACNLYEDIFNSRGSSEINSNSAWKNNLPWIFYDVPNPSGIVSVSGSVLSSTAITTSYSFRGANTVFDFIVMIYDVNGTYLGSESATSGILQICPDRPSIESSAFVFGTTFQSSCFISSSSLNDPNEFPPRFYELNLRFEDSTGTQLFPIPVLITNVDSANTENVPSNWVLVKRFFLVDSISEAAGPGLIQYTSSMALWVTLQEPRESGLIYPPYLSITYSTISSSDPTAVGSSSFAVYYTMSTNSQIQAFVISLSVLGTLGAVYAMFETSAWGRRQGMVGFDGSTILMFIYFSMRVLANAFFVVMFGYSAITLFFFKGQDTVTTVLPNQSQQYNFILFTSLALAFKIVEVIGMILMQSFVDIFLVDWERPRGPNDKVSIWRTYFIANEWNEIQTFRKINFTLQLISVVFFLEVVGFKSLALESPSGSLSQASSTSSDVYIPQYNGVLRFAVAALVYIVISLAQILFRVIFIERFITDQIKEFVDLCSVSNVSVFILANRHYGYYIHGRSVHGRADTDMMDMNNMLKREEENLTSGRGLEAGSDLQTFQMAMPARFRNQYDRIYQSLDSLKNQPAARDGNLEGDKLTVGVRAYVTMRNFLSSFLDHSLKDLDYYVKDKMFIESLLDMEFQEAVDGAFFYNDPTNSFTNILFYGREFALATFEILLFCVVDYNVFNYLLAAVITYVVVNLLAILRRSLSRQNLAKKTLVDKRFLI